MRGRKDVESAIIAAAQEVGIPPDLALAIAERESSFNPRARSSSTIRGLYQMMGKHRLNYGIGDSDDPGEQTRGWGKFFQQVKKEMAGPLGREASDTEGYLGHHFGGARAGRMLRMDPSTPVSQVFTPREIAENPHFAKAGTVGQLNSSIVADIDKRRAKFGGQGESLPLIDFAKMGEPVDTFEMTPDFAAKAEPVEPSFQIANLNMGSAPVASSAPDFSAFGTPVT